MSAGPVVSVSQTKKIYPLGKMSACLVRQTGLLGSGTLILQFFGGATEVSFAPTFVDCSRLKVVVKDVAEVSKT